MFFNTTQHGMARSILLALFISIGALIVFFLTGCGIPEQQIVPACYQVRETENGIFIFEYNPGNQNQKHNNSDGDSLTLFTNALDAWSRDHPELSTTRLERLATTIQYKDSYGQINNVTVVNVLVYTKPSGKPPIKIQPDTGKK